MKKLISLLLISLFVSSTMIQGINPAFPPPPYDLPPPPENIDELLKDFDFEAMLKELEEVFGPVDDKDLKPSAKPLAEPTKPGAAVPTTKLTSEENFKKPVEAEQTVQKLSPDKLKAFYFYMDKFMDLLENMEANINSFNLGIAFKEDLENLKPTAKQIFIKTKVENGRLRSKRLYQKIFFLDSFTDTRKQIFETIEKLEKINKQLEEIKEQEDEEEISEILEEFTKQKDIEKTKRELKTNIKTLLTKNLNTIGNDLEKITVSTQAKAAIEEKKKKSEQLIKDAEAKRKAAPGYRPPSQYGQQSPWSGPSGHSDGYGQSDWPGSRSPSRYSSDQSRPYAPTKGIENKAKDKSKQEPLSGFGSTQTGTEKERTEQVKNATNESISLLKKINTIYKPDNENSIKNILKTPLLSRLASKLDVIEKGESKFNEEQKKQLEKTDTYKNKELVSSLNNFIPIGIRLAKFSSGNESERKAAQNILAQNIAGAKELDKKYTEELSKYEEAILSKINAEPLKEYDPGQGLIDLEKNLRILFAQPVLDEDMIIKKLTEKKFAEILETNLEKKQYLVEQTQLPALKQSINRPNPPENLTAINDTISDWPDTTITWRNTIKELIKKASDVVNNAQINQDDPEQEAIREKISNAIDTETKRLNSDIRKLESIKVIFTTVLGE